jgi:NADPH:quinone reductase-like Zn-dependent oxidoreductase
MSKLVLTAVGGDMEETVVLTKASERELGADEVVIDIEAAPIAR